jgi:hypothetical protein
MNARPRVLVCCNATVRREYIAGEGLPRLEHLADWEWLASEGTSSRAGVWGGVVCTAPLTPRTQRMIGPAELELLKTDAVFVNVSRGAIVDPQALIARAGRGDIRVSIDVFDPEPVPAASPIRDLPNVFMSPHIAGVTAACRPRFFSFMVDELQRFFGGHDTLFDITPSTLANRRGLVTPGV